MNTCPTCGRGATRYAFNTTTHYVCCPLGHVYATQPTDTGRRNVRTPQQVRPTVTRAATNSDEPTVQQ